MGWGSVLLRKAGGAGSAAAGALILVLGQAAWAKRMIVTYRPGTPRHLREQALSRMRAVRLFDINGQNEGAEFAADVVDMDQDGVPSMPGVGTDVAAQVSAQGERPFPGDVLHVEEDFVTNWLSEVSFQTLPFPAETSGALGGLGFAPLKGLSIPAAGRARPRPSISPKAQGYKLPWGIARVNASAAWPVTQGRGVRVCVIDTGADATHPDLAGNIAGGVNIVAGTDDFSDDNGHGTHVSGTIAALGKYAVSSKSGGVPTKVVGVAPQVSIYAVKVMDAQGQGRLSDIIRGIMWCAHHGMQVANMSIGSSQPSVAEEKAVRYAASHGMTIVAATGNDGGPVSYPAAYPETIAVAASDSQDHVATFSNHGRGVRFIAPGVDIISTWMGGHYAAASGTSMASPHVAGLAALAVSQGAKGPEEVLSRLKAAASPLSGLRPVQEGYGMIDAGKIVRQ